MVITGIWFSGRKSRSVNNSVQRSDLGLLVGMEASRPTYFWGLGGGAPQAKGKLHFARGFRLELDGYQTGNRLVLD